MTKKIVVVYNPTSGSGRGNKQAATFRNFLERQQLSFSFIETSFSGDLTTALQSEQMDSLVIIGGDGTINEVINAMPDASVPIGIIPAGTGNDFVKTIDTGKSEKERFDTAIYGEPVNIDAGICNGRKFLNGVGIGFDGQIVAAMMNKKKLLSGQAAYYYEVLRILSTYREKPFEFSMDGKNHRENLILLTIANGTTFGGGFKLTPYADIADGKLDICEIGKISPISRYLNVLKLQNGTHDRLKAVRMHQVESIEIKENPVLNAHIDGEYLGHPPFKIEVLPRHLYIRTKG
ncbi:MAG: diacylglycerol kinase family protein [Cyclobacteriaceae bacterium]